MYESTGCELLILDCATTHAHLCSYGLTLYKLLILNPITHHRSLLHVWVHVTWAILRLPITCFYICIQKVDCVIEKYPHCLKLYSALFFVQRLAVDNYQAALSLCGHTPNVQSTPRTAYSDRLRTIKGPNFHP